MKKRILCAAGTRPEAVKMAPLIQRLAENPQFEVRVLATAQHREMLDQVFDEFGIKPDIDLDVMRPDQQLPELTARLLLAIDRVLKEEQPDAVLAQGDTTTVLTIALSCFYHRIPFGHVEAGLRTHDMYNPFPEEMNRIVAGHLAMWHFAPTERARQSLLREGIHPDAVHVTGNTVIDALLQVAEKASVSDIGVEMDHTKRLILVTAHRRENFGHPFRQICHAIRQIADQNEDIQILYPVHPNRNITVPAHEILGGHPRIRLCAPLDYKPFIAAMKCAYLILTDSGGVQEEAPALGKPVLVLRCETERPEAVEEGVAWIVGTECSQIIAKTQLLIRSPEKYRSMSRAISPYGDGQAAKRISAILATSLLSDSRTIPSHGKT